MAGVPPTLKGPAPQQGVTLQVPIIPLANANLQINRADNGDVQLLLGPVLLALPFTPANARSLADAIRAAASGVHVPGGGGL